MRIIFYIFLWLKGTSIKKENVINKLNTECLAIVLCNCSSVPGFTVLKWDPFYCKGKQKTTNQGHIVPSTGKEKKKKNLIGQSNRHLHTTPPSSQHSSCLIMRTIGCNKPFTCGNSLPSIHIQYNQDWVGIRKIQVQNWLHSRDSTSTKGYL